MGSSPWEFIAPMVVASVLFVSIGAAVILRGPLGRALADRLTGGRADDDTDVRPLRREMEEIRAELASVNERLDFAERRLARDRERERIPGGPGA